MSKSPNQWSYHTTAVFWEYEDCLPSDLSDEEYKRMLPLSRLDGVRLFPYIEIEIGYRYYLCAESTIKLDLQSAC